MHSIRKVIFFVGIWAICSTYSWAGCTTTTFNRAISIPSSIKITPPFIEGKSIRPVFGSYSGISTSVECSYIPHLFLGFSQPMTPTPFAHIYETTVPGVGVKVWSTARGTTTYIENTPTYWYQASSTESRLWLAQISIHFYATKKMLRSGTVYLPAPLLQSMTSFSSVGLSGDSVTYNTMSLTDIDIIAPTPTCGVDVESQNQVVYFPQVSLSQFKDIGSTAASTSFFMRLQCEVGASIYASITDGNMVGNTGQYLTLNTNSTAAGIGIEILPNGSSTPVNLGTTNKFYLIGHIDSLETKYTIPFNARYVKTSSDVTAGSVSAKASILFDYQ